MRAINHALTGALIGLAVGEPVLAVPLAIASHFVCDAIPHYGAALTQEQELRSKLFRNLLYIDAILCFGLVVVLAIVQPVHWQLAAICAFLAASPDLISYRHFAAVQAHKVWRPNLYERFAARIQWFERPPGAVVDLAWFVGCIILILPFLRAA